VTRQHARCNNENILAKLTHMQLLLLLVLNVLLRPFKVPYKHLAGQVFVTE